MKKEINIYDKIIHQRRYNIVRKFLEENKNDILRALNNKARYIDVYNVTRELTNTDINYNWFCQILSEFKQKYIYNLSEAEYNEQMQAISQAGNATPKE